MKIRALFRLIFGTFLLLLIVLLVFSLLLFINLYRLYECQQNRYESFQLADELRQSSDDLTRLARTFVLTGESKYEDYYHGVLAMRGGQMRRPRDYDRIYWDFVAVGMPVGESRAPVSLQKLLEEHGVTREELDLIKEAEANSDALARREEVAMNLVKGLYDDGRGHFTRKGRPNRELAVPAISPPARIALPQSGLASRGATPVRT